MQIILLEKECSGLMPFGTAQSAQVNQPMGQIPIGLLVISDNLQQQKMFTSAVGIMFCLLLMMHLLHSPYSS